MFIEIKMIAASDFVKNNFQIIYIYEFLRFL